MPTETAWQEVLKIAGGCDEFEPKHEPTFRAGIDECLARGYIKPTSTIGSGPFCAVLKYAITGRGRQVLKQICKREAGND